MHKSAESCEYMASFKNYLIFIFFFGRPGGLSACSRFISARKTSACKEFHSPFHSCKLCFAGLQFHRATAAIPVAAQCFKKRNEPAKTHFNTLQTETKCNKFHNYILFPISLQTFHKEESRTPKTLNIKYLY